MVKIKKQLVSQSITNKVTSGTGNTCKYIVIHETANTNKGANANAHARLQANGNSRQASWHYQVDDKEIIQSFGDNIRCWHAGNTNYNNNSIAIEICVNSDGNYKKAVDNAVKLTKHLMTKYNIPVANVIQHNQASGKDCPRYLRSGVKDITWNQFKARLSVPTPNKTNTTSKPVNKPQSNPVGKVKPNYNTKSIVVFLQSINQPFSLAHRKKLASYYGIKNYKGQAVLNLQLLDLLKKDHKATGKIKTGHLNRPVDKPTTNSNTSYKGKRVESKVNGLRFYNKPSWADKDVVGRVDKGYGFPTIVSKIKVGKGYQYKVKNSKGKVYYITASEQYVRVV